MARLGDVATYINGYAFKPTDWSDNGMPIIRIQDLTGNSYKSNRYNGKYASKYEIVDGDVLISWSASLGIYVWHGEKALLNQHIFKVVFDKTEISKSFFIHQVANILEKAASEAHGATMKHLTKPVFDALPFYLPPLDEQRKIAAVLDKVSDLIVKRRQQLDKLDLLIKSKFVEIFGDPQNNEKDWKMRTFKEICTVRQGLQIPISKRLTQFEENCYEYITVAYLHGAKNKEYIKNPKRTVICTKDDILMTRTGNTGMVISNVSGVFHNNFFLIDFDRDKYTKEFLVEYLNLDWIQAEILKRAGTSTIPDLNHSEFYKILIYEPPKELQNQFAAFVDQTEKSKEIVKQSLEKLETLKKALMQEYFG